MKAVKHSNDEGMMHLCKDISLDFNEGFLLFSRHIFLRNKFHGISFLSLVVAHKENFGEITLA